MKKSEIIAKNPEFATTQWNGKTILLPMSRLQYRKKCVYALTPQAARVWQLLDGKRNFGRIKALLLKEFNATPADLEKELNRFLSEALELRAIVRIT